jgi:hypothetical protein
MCSVESKQTFRRNVSPPFSGSKNCSSETSVDFQRTTRRYIPEDRPLHNHCCECLKSYISGIYWQRLHLPACDRAPFYRLNIQINTVVCSKRFASNSINRKIKKQIASDNFKSAGEYTLLFRKVGPNWKLLTEKGLRNLVDWQVLTVFMDGVNNRNPGLRLEQSPRVW